MKTIHALLIEDNPGDARLVQEMLTQLDDIRFDITMLETLAKGAAWLDEHEPDVVLLDLGLPDSQGIGTFKAVQEQAPLIPIVVLTGLQDEVQAIEMAREGAQEYLVKEDINSDVLHHAVQYAIQRKNIERRMARLNSLLRAVRDINQLIVRETDPKALVTNACTYLARVSGYHHVRIFLTDETGETHIGVCAGPDGTEPCPERDLPLCMSQAIADGEMFSPESKGDICSKCTWSDAYNEGNKAISVPLSYLGNVYGALSVFIPAERQPIGGEEGLFQEVADDLAFALYDLELEEKHREAEERYKQLVETTPGLICQLDPDGTTRFVNSYVEELMGYTVEEVIGKNWWNLFYPGDTHEQVDELYERFNAGEDVRGHEMELVDKRGERHVVSWNSFNQWEDGALDKIFGVGMDVTDLQQSEEKYRLLAENAIDVVWRMDLDMRFTYLSSSLEDLVGYEPEEWIGTKPTDHAPSEQAEKMQQAVAEYLEQWPDKDHAIFESKIVDSEGNEIPVEITGRVVLDDDGRPVGLQGATRDITERKRAEEERKELLHHMDERVKELQCLYGLAESFRTRESLEEIFQDVAHLIPSGWHYPEITRGKIIFDGKEYMSEPFDETEWKQSSDIIVNGEVRGSIAVHYLEERTELDEGPFMKEERNLLDTIARNLSEAIERREASEKLAGREKKYREIFHNANDAMYLHTLTDDGMPGAFIEVNDVACEMLGYTHEEFMEMSPMDIDDPDAPTDVPAVMQDLLDEGHATFEMRHVAKNGSHVPVEISSHTFTLNDERFVLSIARDITERKQREKIERKLRQRIEAGLRAGNLAWWEIELPSGDVVFDDRKAEMLGYPPDRFETYEDFTELLHPEDYERAMQAMRDHLDGEAESYEVEYRIRTSDGSYRWFRDIGGITEQDEETGHTRIIGIVEDITERKQAQQELQRRELKLRTLFEETPNPILVANERGQHVDANQAALDFLECDMETLKGMNVFEWAPPSRRERQMEEHTPFDEPRTLETDYLVNGKIKTLLLNVVPLTIDGEKLIYGIGQDITERKKAQEKLEKSEQKFRNLFETMSEGVVYQDADGNITSANPAAERILGLSLKQMQGKTSMDPRWKAIDENGNELPGEQHPAMVALRTGEKVENFVQGIFIPERNEYVWMLVNSIPQFKEGSDEPYQVYSTFRDITQRKQAEDSLRESEKELREAQRLANIGNWRWNLETGDLYLSDEMYTIIGLEKNKAALDVANHEPYYTPETWETFQQAVEKAQTAKESYEIELEVIRENEKNRKVVARGEPLLDEDGTVTGLRGTLQDITERKEIREELQKSERKYRELFNTALVGISVHNAQGDIIAANDAAEEIFGHSEEELREKDLDFWIGKLIRPDGKPMEPSEFPLSVVAETKAPSEGNIVGLSMSEDADTMWFIHSARPIINEGGDVEKVVTSFVDITERKRYERQLLETKNRYRSLFDNSLVGIGLATPEGDIIEVNNAFTDILGYGKAELKAMNAADLYRDPSEREEIRKTLRKNGIVKDHETVLRHMDGACVHVLLSISKIDIGGTSLYQTTCLDITQRKQVQRDLAESEEKYRAIVEGSHDAIFIYRGDRLLFINDRAAELTGYPGEELMDMPIWSLIHPDDLDLVKNVHQQWVQDEEPPSIYQARIVTKDGDIRYCEFSMTAISYQGMEAAMGAVRDITKQKMAEEEREEHVNQLQFITSTIVGVSQMQDPEEICRFVAEQVHTVNEEAIVGVSLYDPARETITIPAVEGLGNMAERVFKVLGGSPTEHTIVPAEMPDDVTALLKTGALEKLPGGLYDAVGGTLPRSACTAMEKLFGIGETYAVGFSIGEIPGGGITLFVPEGEELRHPSAIETIARHVSMALRRRLAENERKQALTEMERALDLEKRFKADASHFFLNPIAIAKGYMEIATEEMPDEPEEKIRRAQTAIRRVEAVIKNIVEKGEIHE